MSSDFPTTQWSQVVAARDPSDTRASEALAALCESYWSPLYAYVLRQGHTPDEASDLTQAYFLELLEKGYLSQVAPHQGSFRSFLLVSLRHFLSHEWEKSRAIKRGGNVRTISLDIDTTEGREAPEPSCSVTPEEVFDRRWARVLLERSLTRLREWADDHDGSERLERLEEFLTGQEPRTPYREVAAELGMTEGTLKAAVHRMRRRFGSILREEIARTVTNPAQIDDELRHLLTVIRPWEPMDN